jgi:hypothetical protein
VQDIGTNQRAGIWCAANPAVGSGHTATINGSTVGSSFSAWSGTATTCADVTNHASCANCTSLQPGSVTPAQNNELVITAVATLPAGGTWTIASGFTVLDQVAASSGVNDGVMVDYQIQTTATAANPIWTGGSEDTGAVIATFKMATASIPVVTHKPIWQ